MLNFLDDDVMSGGREGIYDEGNEECLYDLEVYTLRISVKIKVFVVSFLVFSISDSKA